MPCVICNYLLNWFLGGTRMSRLVRTTPPSLQEEKEEPRWMETASYLLYSALYLLSDILVSESCGWNKVPLKCPPESPVCEGCIYKHHVYWLWAISGKTSALVLNNHWWLDSSVRAQKHSLVKQLFTELRPAFCAVIIIAAYVNAHVLSLRSACTRAWPSLQSTHTLSLSVFESICGSNWHIHWAVKGSPCWLKAYSCTACLVASIQ